MLALRITALEVDVKDDQWRPWNASIREGTRQNDASEQYHRIAGGVLGRAPVRVVS